MWPRVLNPYLSAETICFKDAAAIDFSHYKFFSASQVNSFVTNFDPFCNIYMDIMKLM
jgi:hypothetical protein